MRTLTFRILGNIIDKPNDNFEYQSELSNIIEFSMLSITTFLPDVVETINIHILEGGSVSFFGWLHSKHDVSFYLEYKITFFISVYQ